MARPIRIAVARFAHETVTFLKNDTTLADFIYPGSPALPYENVDLKRFYPYGDPAFPG